MGFVFDNAQEYNSDVSSWDVFNVDYTSSMFYNAQEFNDGVLLWNISKSKIIGIFLIMYKK